jgi:hypothetical protein
LFSSKGSRVEAAGGHVLNYSEPLPTKVLEPSDVNNDGLKHKIPPIACVIVERMNNQ